MSKNNTTVSTYFDGCYNGRYRVDISKRPQLVYMLPKSKVPNKNGYLCIKGNHNEVYCTNAILSGNYYVWDFSSDKVSRCGDPALDLCSWDSYLCKDYYGKKFTFTVEVK